jgi:RNA polymerase sigma-70 factor (ECF subfamily)
MTRRGTTLENGDGGGLTVLLHSWSGGDREAGERALAFLYDDLHACAVRYLRRERRGHLLEPQALVNEALVRLMELGPFPWESRAHFVAMAAVAMRRILVDQARSHLAAKRGGTRRRVPLSDDTLSSPSRNVEVLDLDTALSALEEQDPQQAHIMEFRYRRGYSVEEVAAVLGVSTATVKRKGDRARLWLHHRLRRPPTA